MNPEFITGAVILGGGGSIVAIIKFWMMVGEAVATAKEAKTTADASIVQIAAVSGLLAMFKEQVAKEYVNMSTIRDMEDRLSRNMDRITSRLDELLTLMARPPRE